MTATTTWVSGGQLITVTSEYHSGTIDAFLAAHDQAVRTELAIHPKD